MKQNNQKKKLKTKYFLNLYSKNSNSLYTILMFLQSKEMNVFITTSNKIRQLIYRVLYENIYKNMIQSLKFAIKNSLEILRMKMSIERIKGKLNN